jgi:hypothetical protein
MRRAASGLLSVAALVVLGSSGCARKAPRGPTPEEQGYLPSDFRSHVEFVTQGAVDWGNHRYLCRVSVQVVDRTTAGEPVPRLVAEARAQDAAGVIAARVALNLAGGLRVDARDTLSNLATDRGTLITMGHVAGRTLLKQRRLRNGDMELVFQVPMLGVSGVINKLIGRASTTRAPARAAPVAHGRSIHPAPADGAWPCVASPVARALAAAGGGVWLPDRTLLRRKDRPDASGGGAPAIVIDARRVGVRAALFPRVIDESGATVYAASRALRSAVVAGGLVQYVELLDEMPLSHPVIARGGRDDLHPDGGGLGLAAAAMAGVPRRRRVVVVARAASGPLKADIVVSAADAARIRAEGRSLDEARVIVVVR